MNDPARCGLPADAAWARLDAIVLVGLLVPSRVTVIAPDGVVVESWGRG